MKNQISNNLLVIDGGEVKSNDGGIVEGWAIVFGSPDQPDSSSARDFFTKESFVRGKESFEVPLYYEHGLGLYDEEIGEAVITKESDGWKAMAQINLDSELGKKVYEAVKSEAHGFSTGALSHLVKREAKENDTNFLKRWVAGELSLTKRPAERKAVVESVKSVGDEIVYEEVWEEFDPVSFVLFDAEGKQVWPSDDETKTLEDLKDSAKSVELKYASGSITYNIMTMDEATGKGADITMYEYGGVDDMLAHIQNVINAAKIGIKSAEAPTEEDFDARVVAIVKKLTEAKSNDEADNDVDELKSKLEKQDEELAELKSMLSDREDALTKANERNAQLEILAGAKETITKYTGK